MNVRSLRPLPFGPHRHLLHDGTVQRSAWTKSSVLLNTHLSGGHERLTSYFPHPQKAISLMELSANRAKTLRRAENSDRIQWDLFAVNLWRIVYLTYRLSLILGNGSGAAARNNRLHQSLWRQIIRSLSQLIIQSL